MARPTRIILAAIAFLAAAALSSTCEARGKGGSSGSHASSAGGRSHSHSHSTGSRRSGGSAHARRTAAEAAIGRDRRDVAAEREFVRRDNAKLERDWKAGNRAAAAHDRAVLRKERHDRDRYKRNLHDDRRTLR